MLVGEPRKWRRDRNLAAERGQKMKERTRGKRRIQEEVGCHLQEGVPPWRKRNLVRRIGTQENCGSRKKFSPTGIRMTHRAKVARRKGNIVRNKWTMSKAERRIQKVWIFHEGRKRVKDLGGGRPPYLRK
jgi:hypothetical protein